MTKEDLTTKAIEMFLYSPISDKIEMPCMCGGKLKFSSLGGDFGRGEAIFKCDSCEKYLVIAYQFVIEKPDIFDRYDVVKVVRQNITKHNVEARK